MNATSIQSTRQSLPAPAQSGAPWSVVDQSAPFATSPVLVRTDLAVAEVSPYRALWLATMARLDASTRDGDRLMPRQLIPAHAEHLSKNGRFKIQAKAWLLSRSGRPVIEFRMVLIEGSSNAILNTWAFPFVSCKLPVFAAELIAMAGAPRLTFMDVQVPALDNLTAQKTRNATRSIRERYQNLVCDETPPEWAIDATAGNYLFLRTAEPSLFPQIQQAYMSLLDAYLEVTKDPYSGTGDQLLDHQNSEALRHYQLHHLQHSPGRVFLGKVFGEHWTDDFLNHFLFTLPGE